MSVNIRGCQMDGSDAVFTVVYSEWMAVQLRVGEERYAIQPRLDDHMETTVLRVAAEWAASHTDEVPYDVRRRLAALVSRPASTD